MSLEAQERVVFSCVCWKVAPFINIVLGKKLDLYELVFTDAGNDDVVEKAMMMTC